MQHLAPTLSHLKADESLGKLIACTPESDLFEAAIRRMRKRFNVYATTSPEPLPASGLLITPSIRYQSELYLPLSEIRNIFNRLYRTLLTYPPVLESTPFHDAMSWADVFASLLPRFQVCANPAILLNSLLNDRDLLIEFLFASFLPRRFYGGFRRYPAQRLFISDWLHKRENRQLRFLDAACGTGEDTYGMAQLLLKQGYDAEVITIEGWTLEPLETWAAVYCCFPHDIKRQAEYRKEIEQIFEQGYNTRIHFSCVDLGNTVPTQLFDLILCNGFLGGPLLHEADKISQVVANLAKLLAPGGILLAADNFHGGWKQHCPQQKLQTMFEINGLKPLQTGEGVGGQAI
jgi:SAM-dependent methyltransferase